MSDSGKLIEEATGLLAAGDEARALRLLHAAVDAGRDPAVLREVHELATMGHESSRGFHKIEWHRLMLDTEAEAPAPAST